MRVLVTGAGGFVGEHLVRNLLEAGHEVVAAARRPFEPPSGVALEVFDIRQAVHVKRAVESGHPDAVIHLAAQASVQESWKDPGATYRVNLLGTSNLLEALRDRTDTRVLLVGSAQVYGRPALDRPLLESDPLRPASPYALSKVAQELLGRLYFSEFGRPIVAARPFNHTGPGQKPDYVVGAFCSRILEMERGGERTMHVGRLDNIRDFLDVRDVVNAYRLLVESGAAGEAYNVASGEGVRIGDLLKILLDASGLGSSVEVIEDAAPRAGDPPMLIGDNSKIRAAVGWEPRIPIEQSLLETLDWYRSRKEGAP